MVKSVLDRTGASEKYASLMEFYEKLIYDAKENGCDTYVDESIYFKGLRKLGILQKGKLIKSEGIVIEDETGQWYPNEKSLKVLLGLEDESYDDEGLYKAFAIKRGVFRFDMSSEVIEEKVAVPLMRLLCEFNKAMVKAAEKIEADEARIREVNATLPKELRITTPLTGIKEARPKIVAKYFN